MKYFQKGAKNMAVWQVEFSLNNSLGTQKPILSEESIIRLCSVLPIGKSWHDDLTVYGELDGTCVCVWNNHDSIEISCRIDVSSLEEDVINALVDFAKANNLTFVYNQKAVDTSSDSIKVILTNSPAYKFLENPNVFFDNI